MTIGIGLETPLDTDYGVIPAKALIRGIVIGKVGVLYVNIKYVRTARKYLINNLNVIVSNHTSFFIDGKRVKRPKVDDYVDTTFGKARIEKMSIVTDVRIVYITVNSIKQIISLKNGVLLSGR